MNGRKFHCSECRKPVSFAHFGIYGHSSSVRSVSRICLTCKASSPATMTNGFGEAVTESGFQANMAFSLAHDLGHDVMAVRGPWRAE